MECDKGAVAKRAIRMKTRTKLIGIAAVALMLGIAYTAFSQPIGPGFGPPFMHHGMRSMGGAMTGPGMMDVVGGRHDPATMGQLRDIHALFLNHDRIKRTVTNLANGIRTETTSDDPEIVQLIKTHVTEMGRRVVAGDDPGLPIESSALHAIFRDKDKIHTTYEATANGVVVVQTSDDPKVVAELQQHASQVTEFVENGMTALHTAMMRNAGGMMHGMRGLMRGGMMHGPMGPNGMMQDRM